MIYIILGMHKSGTTLVAEILHYSGINMVEYTNSHISYDQGNKYERESAAAFNREILDTKPFANGFSSLDLPAPKALHASDELKAKIRSLVTNLDNTHYHWGFKDPRTCWTYPIWASELPEHRLIAIYRPPDEIWPRYRQNRRPFNNPYLAWKFIARWCEYNSAILSHLYNTSTDFLILDYRELMESQNEFNCLQHFVGFNLEDKRVASLRRNHPGKYPLLNVIMYLYRKRTGCSHESLIAQFKKLRKH